MPTDTAFQICKRCIMDTSVNGIRFDENGECIFCKVHDKMDASFPLNEKGDRILHKIIETIKKRGKGEKYDCIVGVSGGRDSTYLIYKAKKEWGLRPLAVHFNDGFDNPVCGVNIKNAVETLDVDLRTITSDWRESKAIRLSLIKASLSTMEMGTDMGIVNSLYGVATKENIKSILYGNSFRTEGMCPLTWSYFDDRFLKAVLKQFGNFRLRKWSPTDPGYNQSFAQLFYYIILKGIRFYTPFYHYNYIRENIEKVIINEFGWSNPGAHYYDDLYQSLVWNVTRIKFKFDKRRFNYSALIRSGQMKREYAMGLVAKKYVIEDPAVINLCVKRLGLTHDEFQNILKTPPKTFRDYPNNYWLIKSFQFPIWLLCQLRILPVGLYDRFFNCI